MREKGCERKDARERLIAVVRIREDLLMERGDAREESDHGDCCRAGGEIKMNISDSGKR